MDEYDSRAVRESVKNLESQIEKIKDELNKYKTNSFASSILKNQETQIKILNDILWALTHK